LGQILFSEGEIATIPLEWLLEVSVITTLALPPATGSLSFEFTLAANCQFEDSRRALPCHIGLVLAQLKKPEVWIPGTATIRVKI
jgi:hypothetical protein